MPFPIQRVPRGLNTLLSTFGGLTPRDLADQVAGTLDLLQLYGLTQWQNRSANAPGLVVFSVLSITVPANETWVLFNAAVLVQKTATMTALAGGLFLGPDAGSLSAVAWQMPTGIFGAAGAIRIPYVAPYPRVLPGGSVIAAQLDQLGTDANANVLLTASVGVLG